MRIISRGPISLVQVRKAHDNFKTRHHTMVQRVAEEAGKFAKQYVKDHPTFTPRTGTLQKRTGYKVLIRRNGKVLRIQNATPYAAAIDQGARPHVIKPRNARALRFVVRGKVVFTKRVMHPGNKPYKFLYRATTAAGRVLEDKLRFGMWRVAKTF